MKAVRSCATALYRVHRSFPALAGECALDNQPDSDPGRAGKTARDAGSASEIYRELIGEGYTALTVQR